MTLGLPIPTEPITTNLESSIFVTDSLCFTGLTSHGIQSKTKKFYCKSMNISPKLPKIKICQIIIEQRSCKILGTVFVMLIGITFGFIVNLDLVLYLSY